MNSIPNHMATAAPSAEASRPAANWIGRPMCLVVRPKVGASSPAGTKPSAP